MVRIWFKDGSHMDVVRGNAWIWERQPDWDWSEELWVEQEEYEKARQ